MPSVLLRSVLPTPICQMPAFSVATFCGISRTALSTSPQVSSAAA
ncbi:MAG: hypothetical protein WDN08_15330 [Rhizomicrobium sp.]